MRKILNNIVLFISNLCSKYIEEHIYNPQHADKDFWGDDL